MANTIEKAQKSIQSKFVYSTDPDQEAISLGEEDADLEYDPNFNYYKKWRSAKGNVKLLERRMRNDDLRRKLCEEGCQESIELVKSWEKKILKSNREYRELESEYDEAQIDIQNMRRKLSGVTAKQLRDEEAQISVLRRRMLATSRELNDLKRYHSRCDEQIENLRRKATVKHSEELELQLDVSRDYIRTLEAKVTKTSRKTVSHSCKTE